MLQEKTARLPENHARALSVADESEKPLPQGVFGAGKRRAAALADAAALFRFEDRTAE